MDFRKMMVVAAVVSLTGLTTHAAVIDDFNDGGGSFSAPDVDTELGLSGVIGGERQVTTTKVSGPGTVSAGINTPIPGVADLSSSSFTVGNWLFEYGANTALDAVLDGNAFQFIFSFSDLGGTLDLTLTDGGGITETVSGVVIAGFGPSEVLIPFGSFSTIDFSEIDYIAASITGASGSDISADFFGTVPAPAALPAGIALLAAFGFFRRRRLA